MGVCGKRGKCFKSQNACWPLPPSCYFTSKLPIHWLHDDVETYMKMFEGTFRALFECGRPKSECELCIHALFTGDIMQPSTKSHAPADRCISWGTPVTVLLFGVRERRPVPFTHADTQNQRRWPSNWGCQSIYRLILNRYLRGGSLLPSWHWLKPSSQPRTTSSRELLPTQRMPLTSNLSKKGLLGCKQTLNHQSVIQDKVSERCSELWWSVFQAQEHKRLEAFSPHLFHPVILGMFVQLPEDWECRGQ